MRRAATGDRLGRTRGDDFAAGMAAFGTEVDDVVGDLDHVEMMFNQHHRVASVDEPIQRRQEPLDVGEVQAGRRLVEDVEGVLRPLQRRSARWRS